MAPRKSKALPEEINYKRPDVLRQYIDENYKILPRRRTKLDSRQQRILTREIKRARKLAILPFSVEHKMPG